MMDFQHLCRSANVLKFIIEEMRPNVNIIYNIHAIIKPLTSNKVLVSKLLNIKTYEHGTVKTRIAALY